MVQRFGQIDDCRVMDFENTHYVVNGTSELEVENFDENAGSTCRSVEETRECEPVNDVWEDIVGYFLVA